MLHLLVLKPANYIQYSQTGLITNDTLKYENTFATIYYINLNLNYNYNVCILGYLRPS